MRDISGRNEIVTEEHTIPLSLTFAQVRALERRYNRGILGVLETVLGANDPKYSDIAHVASIAVDTEATDEKYSAEFFGELIMSEGLQEVLGPLYACFEFSLVPAKLRRPKTEAKETEAAN